jgi:hypothetical protein
MMTAKAQNHSVRFVMHGKAAQIYRRWRYCQATSKQTKVCRLGYNDHGLVV